MATWTCGACTAEYSVGAPRCPQCSATDPITEEGSVMPKVSVHGGASVAAEETVIEGEHGPELVPLTDPRAAEAEPEEEGGEESSPGKSSPRSSATQRSTPAKKSAKSPSTARSAGSPSELAEQTGPSSSVAATDGGPTGSGSDSGSSS